MVESLRNYREALVYARGEHDHESRDWTGYCQMFVRTCYGIPAVFGSAWAQWQGADPEDRHVGGDPGDAPLGSALCYKGSSPFGHITLAATPFRDADAGMWSNDLVLYGKIDKVLRTAPTTHWGQRYLGYLTAVNDYDLRLREAKPPKPKQDKPYKTIEAAIGKMQDALTVARNQKDERDIKVFREEIARLKRLYAHRRRY